MQTIQASEFKAKCLALMDAAAATGETWVITKNGKPVAELRPYSGQHAETPFGLHPTLEIRGDVISPLEEGLWKALARSSIPTPSCGWTGTIRRSDGKRGKGSKSNGAPGNLP